MTASSSSGSSSNWSRDFQGAKRPGGLLLLEGGLDWKPLSLSPKDMDFIEAKNAAAREIALALGRAAYVARDSGRQHVFQLSRSEPILLAKYGVAAGSANGKGGLGVAFACLRWRPRASRRSRSGGGAGARARSLVGAHRRVSFLTLNEEAAGGGTMRLWRSPVASPAPENDETVVIRKYRPDQCARAARVIGRRGVGR